MLMFSSTDFWLQLHCLAREAEENIASVFSTYPVLLPWQMFQMQRSHKHVQLDNIKIAMTEVKKIKSNKTCWEHESVKLEAW